MDTVKKAVDQILDIDPWLTDYTGDLELRVANYLHRKDDILQNGQTLSEFANAHKYYGFHKEEGGWTYREWAPNADALYLVGDFNDWNTRSHPLEPVGKGNWVIHLDGENALKHGDRIKVIVHFDGMDHYKIPLYIHRVIQETDDKGMVDWMGIIWDGESFPWTDRDFHRSRKAAPLIYEAHVGMALAEPRIGTYREFADQILPRVQAAGYNTVQLMAIMQHPYYGSFGYHVANFFAASSWFGTPEDLKYLVNKAHEMGISVLMDLVHSHAVKNTAEGINRFDGTQTQFFYEGQKGLHDHWDSMCFNYGKTEVIHFLLSNLKYWLEEFHFDGFRFDGITSMLYWDHGIGSAFTDYSKYFSMNTNTDAVTYLTFASELCKEVNPNCILVAEDMSGMPGLCLPPEKAGMGFDYRLSMGVPDLWIRLLKKNDHDWNMYEIYHELTQRRPYEKKVAYAESHDQALVGDKTLFFRMTDAEIYWHMQKQDDNFIIARAMALHKMIRLVTITSGSDGYLNFIGNEFGHPEWVDFPRLENNWSYHYCRRQWNLLDDENLKYQYLNHFDKEMLKLVRKGQLLGPSGLQLLWIDQDRKLIAYRKSNYIFLFNFHPENSYESFQLPIHEEGTYRVIFSTDRPEFGGFNRIDEDYLYKSMELAQADYSNGVTIYTPSRTALVLKRVTEKEESDSEQLAISQMIQAEKLAQEALEDHKEK